MSEEKERGIGDNSVDATGLKSYLDRIETLVDDRKALTDDLKSVYDEAKGAGFSTAVIRRIVRERAMDKAKLRDAQELYDVYTHSIGWDIFS